MTRAEGLGRRRFLSLAAAAAGLAACRPLVEPGGFAADAGRPRLERGALVAGDGARLPLQVWPARNGEGEAVAPWAVIVGLHGMDDYSGAFTLPGPYWAARGVATYAYDQRGFGGTASRGDWAGERPMAEDLRTVCALVRARHPGAILAVVGESMGGAVAVTAFASDRPPSADRLVLASPAVWGWREQGPLNDAFLWTGAHLAPASRLSAPDWLARRIWASDNIKELRRMGSDPRMIGPTRIDTLYGLVGLMQDAEDRMGDLRVLTLFQYGSHDEIIPEHAAFAAARRASRTTRTAYYRTGWHLLLRDLHRSIVLDDVLAFMRTPGGILPSRAPSIPI